MPNKILIQEMDDTPPQICFADFADDFLPTAGNDLRKGTDTEVQLILASVANNAARQSAQFDFGENRAQTYIVRAAFEMAATPNDGGPIEFALAPSSSPTAATGNPGGVSGLDAAYTGYSSNLTSSFRQLDFIGVFSCTVQVTAVAQIAIVARYFPVERYGSLVVYDKSGAAFHSDDIEIHIVFDPIVPEIQ